MSKIDATPEQIVEAIKKQMREWDYNFCSGGSPSNDYQLSVISDTDVLKVALSTLPTLDEQNDIPDGNDKRKELQEQLTRMQLEPRYIDGHSQGFADCYNWLHGIIKTNKQPLDEREVLMPSYKDIKDYCAGNVDSEDVKAFTDGAMWLIKTYLASKSNSETKGK